MSSFNAARPILKSRLASIKSPRPMSRSHATLRVPTSPRVASLSSKVHFPPTPTISVIFETHANEVYDRTAIVVSPSSCAIPWSEKNKTVKLTTRATMADIFCSPVESLVEGAAGRAVDYSDSEDSGDDSVPALKPRGASKVRFAAPPLRSPIPGRKTKFDMEKALSFTPMPVSPYPRSPSFDPRSPSTEQGSAFKVTRAGVNRDARVDISSRVQPIDSKSKDTLEVPKASTTTRRRPAQLNLDTIVPTSKRFPPPGLPVSPVPPQSINSVLADLSDESGSESDSDSEGGLQAAFWRSVQLEKKPSAASSEEAQALVSPALLSPFPTFLYKNLKSPALPRRSRANAGDFMGNALMSPNTLGKNMQGMLSPAVSDPAASFSSFAAAFAVQA